MTILELSVPFIIFFGIVFVLLASAIVSNTINHRSKWPSMTWRTHVIEGIKSTFTLKGNKK